MVSFHDNPEKYNSVAMLTKLDEEVAESFACCSKAWYTLATKLNSIRPSLLKVGNRVDRRPQVVADLSPKLATKLTVSATKSTAELATKLTVQATVDFVADLLRVSATVDFVASVCRA